MEFNTKKCSNIQMGMGCRKLTRNIKMRNTFICRKWMKRLWGNVYREFVTRETPQQNRRKNIQSINRGDQRVRAKSVETSCVVSDWSDTWTYTCCSVQVFCPGKNTDNFPRERQGLSLKEGSTFFWALQLTLLFTAMNVIIARHPKTDWRQRCRLSMMLAWV